MLCRSTGSAISTYTVLCPATCGVTMTFSMAQNGCRAAAAPLQMRPALPRQSYDRGAPRAARLITDFTTRYVDQVCRRLHPPQHISIDDAARLIG